MIGHTTQGPWRVDACYIDGENRVLDGEGFEVAYIPYSQSLARNEQMANAALIAAAPEMVEALKTSLLCIQALATSSPSADLVCAEIRAALRKAGVLQ